MSDQPPEIPSNGILEVKLDYIQKDINTIKLDIKEIKSDFVTRREFIEGALSVRKENKDALDLVYADISPLKKIAYGSTSVLGLAILGAIIKLILK